MRSALFLSVLISLYTFSVQAQKQNNQWRFGLQSAIDFNTSPPTFPSGAALPSVLAPLITGEFIEGSASVADRNTGALLFYTDGITIWNALNQPMPNGSNLGGSDVLSSYMAAVIVPLPGSCTKYYVFCQDDYEEGSDGITYSVVDMTLDNGLGDVVAGQKSIPLFDNNETELLLAYPKSSGDGYWLISNGPDPVNPTLASFEVTALGVNPVPVLSPVILNGSGKVNYQGTKFVCTGEYDPVIGNFLGFQLYDFDASSGQITNPVNIPFDALGEALQYFEFSFDGNYLYAGGPNTFYHFDLSSGTPSIIAASGTAVPVGNPSNPHYAPQMGPDGNLYYVVASSITGLGPNTVYRIENPGNPVSQIGPISPLPPNVAPSICLPQWIHLLPEISNPGSITLSGDSCLLSTQNFSIIGSDPFTSVIWNFGDPNSGLNNTSSLSSPSHSFSDTGTYAVRAIVTYICSTDTLDLSVAIVDCSNTCQALMTIGNDSCVQKAFSFSVVSDSAILSTTWNFGDPASGTENTSDLLSPSHTFTTAGDYTVTALVALPCGIDTVKKTLRAIACSASVLCPLFVPNIFTPNNDGVNDVFYPLSACPYTFYEFSVFNRWGERVFTSDNPNDRWNGAYKGAVCNVGVYVYVLRYHFENDTTQTKSGSVTLLR
jgi:gliding motility-associated-like protein